MLNGRSRGRLDPFRVLSPRQREAQRAAYLEFLHKLDGDIDFADRVLPKREDHVRKLESDPVTWRGHLDTDGFYQHFHRVGRPELDAKTLWILAIAVSNEGERHGAEAEMRRFDRGDITKVDETKLYHVLQEDYHTRLLLEACRCLGLPGLRLIKPKLAHRIVIQAMTYLPDSLRYVLILCGEVTGAVVFKVLHDTCTFFPEAPEVQARLRAILREIVRDETLHVLHCRSRLGAFGLRVARAMVPLVTAVLMRDLPQLRALGCDREALMTLLRAGIEIPAEVDWVEPDFEDLASA